MRIGTFAVLAAFLLLGGCPGPIYESRRLEAIRTESARLMAAYVVDPVQPWGELPRSEWPPAIASVHPENVFVQREQVRIIVVPFFDGGWGYEVTPRKENLGMLTECYEHLRDGVFWHGPC
ncbi:hypothetical protein PIB19_10670 [Sphingomonas sp. 7/4-4]|uniref:hypothetical protein n=1 Tax=Sphingomonas sp. 7/4-4 TaxID=3018446 RepID=UPI0022F3AEAF|nr:hypothetical protein [Sphingomonas sp. 7/4-4]WBY09696.1 hypothetical protein PIB19_10670 [Sphingomonas sp. 7/4-4]